MCLTWILIPVGMGGAPELRPRVAPSSNARQNAISRATLLAAQVGIRCGDLKYNFAADLPHDPFRSLRNWLLVKAGLYAKRAC